MKQKPRFKNLGIISYWYQLSVYGWPIYRYRYQPNISVNLYF